MIEGWFATRELEEGVHLIGEPPHVNSFLILGRNRAVLFDTGIGIANIQSVVRSISDLDVLVVNSHYHFDHTGGNHLFPQIAIQRRGIAPLKAGPDQEWLDRYADYASDMLQKFKLYKELDDAYFRLLTAETAPRLLPESFVAEKWTYRPTVPTRILEDGDVLDLGNRSLRVIHTPGHTPDCICLFDERGGALFAGDTLSTGPIYAHLPDSDVELFARSTRRLTDEVLHGAKVVYPAHMLRYATDAGFIKEVADGFDAIVSGEGEPLEGVDVFGEVVAEFWFNRFSIVVSRAWHRKNAGVGYENAGITQRSRTR